MRPKIDDTVKMSDDFKNQPHDGIIDHIKEFGNCIGKIIGYTFDDTEDYLDVRWEPSKLRYGYHYNELIIINSDNPN